MSYVGGVTLELECLKSSPAEKIGMSGSKFAKTLEEVLVDDAPVLLGDYHAGRMEFKVSEAARSGWCSVDDPWARNTGYALRIDARTSPAR